VLPCELLHRLPAWCVYIELDAPHCRDGLHGVFAHLEYDPNDGREELRLLLDTDAALVPIPLHLGPWDLREALARMGREAQRRAPDLAQPTPAALATHAEHLAPLLSLLLYLCSDEADYPRPPPPTPKRTKRGPRLFPPDRPATWDVGVRLGAALRQAHRARDPEPEASGTGPRPRPHIRRAHWHTYWKGPREGARTAHVQWLPPIPVNLDDDIALPAVIHPVR
jgi:hypothetical protein